MRDKASRSGLTKPDEGVKTPERKIMVLNSCSHRIMNLILNFLVARVKKEIDNFYSHCSRGEKIYWFAAVAGLRAGTTFSNASLFRNFPAHIK